MLHRQGLSTLTALIVITSLLLASGIALHISLRQTLVGFTDDLVTLTLRSRALSCLYEGWDQVVSNSSYSGATLSLDTGACSIVVTNQGNTYMITAESTDAPNHLTYRLTLRRQGQNFTPITFEHIF